MPVILLERIPLPRLRTYTAFSVVLLACAVYYAHQIATEVIEPPEPDVSELDDDVTPTEVYYVHDRKFELLKLEHAAREEREHDLNLTDALFQSVGQNASELAADSYGVKMATVLLSETWCIWSLVNTACCCLILLGRGIQKIVFGELRVSEHQHLQDKFWNFAFYKFIFIFGVMNVQSMEEVVLWCTWFGVLAGLHLLAQLCKDRFEYLSFSPATPTRTHIKVLILLMAIQAACAGLFVACVFIGYVFAGINIFCFMAAEVILLIIKTSYVIARYTLHLWDLRQHQVWENRSVYGYYSELVFELVAISVDFCNHLHMLLWSNIFLSMASLVICMQLRYLFHELQRRIRRHKNYLRVVNIMEEKFPMATSDELDEASGNCAICWESMEHARRLPCGHFFHNACLRSWLEQDITCPICRDSLSELQRTAPPQPGPPAGAGDAPPGPTINRHQQGAINPLINHFFQFDGSRYVSWLPSFSVEVTHTQLLGNRLRAPQMQTSQLDNMARQVQEVFPAMTLSVLQTDLQVTRSVELTIENIVEGRLQQPQTFPRPGPRDSDSDSNSGSDSGDSTSSTSSVGPSYSQTRPPGLFVPMEPSTSNVVSPSSDLYDAISPPGVIPEAKIAHSMEMSSAKSSEDNTRLKDFPNLSGGRFSKSPTERQTMLESRKEMLVQQARRKFETKEENDIENTVPSATASASNQFEASQFYQNFVDNQTLNPSAQNEENDIRLRRERAFLAAQRRLNLD